MRYIIIAFLCIFATSATSQQLIDYKRSGWIYPNNWTIVLYNVERNKTWHIWLTRNNRLTVANIDGTLLHGDYRIVDQKICMILDLNGTEFCGGPVFEGNQINWEIKGYPIVSFIEAVYRTEDVDASGRGFPDRFAQPKACAAPEQFCQRLAVQGAACGFLSESAMNFQLNDDATGLGAATSGAACSALIAEANEMPISLFDLTVSALGSAFFSQAMKDARDDPLAAAINGFFAAEATSWGISRCEEMLSQVCR